MAVRVDPFRDGFGVVLALLDGDLERCAETLDGYVFTADALHLLIAVVEVLTATEDLPVLRDRLARTALSGAGRSSA